MIKRIIIIAGFFTAVWVANGKEKYTIFPTESKIIFDFCFFENGEKLAVADNTTIKIFSTRTQQELDEIASRFSDRILAVDISKDNKFIAFGGRDGSLVIKELLNKNDFLNLQQKGNVITTLNFSPDSRMLAIGSSEGKVLVYDIENKTVKFEFTDHKKDITSVKFSPDGKLLATAGADKKINLYSTKNGNLITSLSGHKSWVRSLSFNQNDELLSCGDDSKIILWNLKDLQQITSDRVKLLALRLITSIDAFHEENSYAVSGINGRLIIKTLIGSYSANLRKPVNKVLITPSDNYHLRIVAALQGKGVVLMKAEDMKFKNR